MLNSLLFQDSEIIRLLESHQNRLFSVKVFTQTSAAPWTKKLISAALE